MSAGAIQRGGSLQCELCQKAFKQPQKDDLMKLDRLRSKLAFSPSDEGDVILNDIKALSDRGSPSERATIIEKAKGFFQAERAKRVEGIVAMFQRLGIYHDDLETAKKMSDNTCRWYLTLNQDQGSDYLVVFKDLLDYPVPVTAKELFKFGQESKTSTSSVSTAISNFYIKEIVEHERFLGAMTKEGVELALRELNYDNNSAPMFIYYDKETKKFVLAFFAFENGGITQSIQHKPICLHRELDEQIGRWALASDGIVVLSPTPLKRSIGTFWFEEEKQTYKFNPEISTRKQAEEYLETNGLRFVTYKLSYAEILKQLGSSGSVQSVHYVVCTKVEEIDGSVQYRFELVNDQRTLDAIISLSSRRVARASLPLD